ncbi:hypothetical protein HY251_02910 [bacterium]|nr:hypothetical protein [bacterium]
MIDLLSFAAVCAATAFVCTAVKEDEPSRLGGSSLRVFGVLAAGIGAFALVIQVFTMLAG